MKIDLTQNLYDTSGNKLTVKENEQIITPELRIFLKNIALSETDDSKNNKDIDFNIFLELNNTNEEVELENKKIVRLQEKLPKVYGILIYGQINAILEGKKNPLAKTK